MRFKLFIWFSLISLVLVLGAGIFFQNTVSAQTDSKDFTVEVSRYGFDGTPGELRLQVEEGQDVTITFLYGDGDLPNDNPHQIFISEYNISTDVLDRENRQSTVRFTASRTGEVTFTCVLFCTGHDNLQRGLIASTPSTGTPAVGEAGSLLFAVSEQAESGQPIILTAFLRDNKDKPVVGAPVKFLVEVDFFIDGFMEIGEAVTNQDGVAELEYVMRQTGDRQVVARYIDIEATSAISLAESAEPFYQAGAGLPNTWPLPELFIGPRSALEPGEGVNAPTTGLRIPGGPPALLFLAYVFTLILVWSLYFRVMYLVFRISPVGKTGGSNIRMVPSIGMLVILALAIFLVLILITGPYSHAHLFG